MLQPARPFLPDKAAHQLGIASGIVLFAFISTHLLNHSLTLISIDFADEALKTFKLIWRNPLGTLLLYGSFLVHYLLALRTLYLRRHMRLPARMLIQVLFGLSIPVLIAQHAVSARVPALFGGFDSTYWGVIRGMWTGNGLFGLKMVLAVIVVWVHGCIGLYAAIRFRDWFPRMAPWLFALAILLPTLALVGVLVNGRQMEAAAKAGGQVLTTAPDGNVVRQYANRPPLDLAAIERRVYLFFGLGLGLVVVLRAARSMRRNAPEIRIIYAHGPQIRVPRGTSILEASRIGRVDHYSVCGGKGRCSTCRVRIIDSDGPLPPPSAMEQATLSRIRAAPDTRLSCQTRPDYDVTVALLLEPPVGGDLYSGRQIKQAGREKEIVVLFCDIRNFTTISESRLPYDIVFLLNRYFSVVGRAVEEAKGQVDKFIGDGVMALFGIDATEPSEACRQALRAAATIVAETEKLNQEMMQEFGVDLRIAIGIHFGPAIVGMIGYGKVAGLTAIGDTVNVGSRLEAVAKQFNVAIAASEPIMLLAHVPYDGLSSRSVSLKGRKTNMRVYLLSVDDAKRYA
ncbi:2Fe-2S iron-sulfur cluster binding domain-containing protein [Rhizobium daejeonense]|uniref:2Fe-2S iron-sulfur cluster binding domain-containing protein n=1 Tax=Rhizobium daejeonense TaxID=240521 RepID=A0A6M1S3V5_9HYPH|nr:adenylate/guanylate cyclase domain-containing protein [Rhizobium daejeonense]NGO65643.1 2Fe-2S iron-sulfur cluster binding domain-containing protein [Rhizobium daejeonense]